jgi:hypothetical protein
MKTPQLKISLWCACVAIGGIAILVLLQQLSFTALLNDNLAFRAQIRGLRNHIPPPPPALLNPTPASVANEELKRLRREARDVYKLRNEVHGLTKAEAESRQALLKALRDVNAAQMNKSELTNDYRLIPDDREYTQVERAIQMDLMETGRQLAVWWQAFLAYAGDHGGVLPLQWRDALPYFPANFRSTVDMDNFYPGATIPEQVETLSWETRAIFRDTRGVQLPDGRVIELVFFASGRQQLFSKIAAP